MILFCLSAIEQVPACSGHGSFVPGVGCQCEYLFAGPECQFKGIHCNCKCILAMFSSQSTNDYYFNVMKINYMMSQKYCYIQVERYWNFEIWRNVSVIVNETSGLGRSLLWIKWSRMRVFKPPFAQSHPQPPWRNRLARSAVNRKVGGSSPPGGEDFFIFYSLVKNSQWFWVLTKGLVNQELTDQNFPEPRPLVPRPTQPTEISCPTGTKTETFTKMQLFLSFLTKFFKSISEQ